MKALLFFGGPLIVAIGFGFYSGLLEFAHNLEGFEHEGGVEPGGTFQVEQQPENRPATNVSQSANYRIEEQSTGFANINGLEIEQEPIEYRDGASGEYNKTKQPGLAKYANIVMRRPTGFDWKTLRFEFQRQGEIDKINAEYDAKIKEAEGEGEAMIEIDPPVLVIPAN